MAPPPGKNNSLGDALNWEILLRDIPEGESLYFVTDDKDYYSPIDKNIFNTYLSREWTTKKNATIFYYRSLSDFFKEHFPNITLASELEKDLVIRDLANSSSFANTHTIISKLNKYPDFAIAQVNAILDAVNSNNQVYWIITDADVNDFLMKVIKGKEDEINQEGLDELLNTIAEARELEEAEDEDDPPFK